MTRWLSVSLVLTATAFAASWYVDVYRYDQLPAELPVHWNIRGEPDGWVGKQHAFGAFFLLPTVMAGMVLLSLLLPWLSPKPFDVDRFRGTFGYAMMLTVALFGYMHAVILLGSLRQPGFDLGRWLIAGLLFFFALIGNVLGRLRRNFWMGVRTPWTLASEAVWIQTHRLSAWVFVFFGVGGGLAILLGAPLLWCFTAVMIFIVAVPIGYSLVLYKRLERQGRL